MKTLPKGSASSKRVAADQGGPGAAGSGQGRKEGKYTLDAALDQPCKFHSTPSREATHSMHTRRFSFVLIDGGSSINLLYRSSIEKLGIPLASWNRAGSPSMASC
jgi:hypothetical protein